MKKTGYSVREFLPLYTMHNVPSEGDQALVTSERDALGQALESAGEGESIAPVMTAIRQKAISSIVPMRHPISENLLITFGDSYPGSRIGNNVSVGGSLLMCD